jgi:cbb3-type cytochrome c oxidase subunit III
MRFLLAVLVFGTSFAAAQDGATLYKQNCAACHDGGMDRAPSRDALKAMSADRVLAAMETGAMISMASRRTAAERRAIAEFVSGQALRGVLVTKPARQAMCAPAGGAFDPASGPAWNACGMGSPESVKRYAMCADGTYYGAHLAKVFAERQKALFERFDESVRQQIAQASQSGYWLAELIVPERAS